MVESVAQSDYRLIQQNFGLLPFNRAVSKFNIEDDISLDIVTTSRKILDYKITRLLKTTAIDQATRLQPILGDAGTGKSHYYWVLKARERELRNEVPFRVIYVSSPPTPYRLFHHIYSCLADELLHEHVFYHMTDLLITELGMDPASITPKTDPSYIISKILPSFPGIFADVIKVLVIHRIYGSEHPKGALALRWLLGETLTEEELAALGVHSVLEQDDVCLAMIKIICDLSGNVLVFYFDEMESPYRSFGPEAQQRFFEYIKRLYNEVRNVLIVTACLKDVWEDIISTADQPTLSRMEPEAVLEPFSAEDLKVFYLRGMNRFWEFVGAYAPPSDPYFPLSEEEIGNIYKKYGGNQRECIKAINRAIENKVFAAEMAELDISLEVDRSLIPLEKNGAGFPAVRSSSEVVNEEVTADTVTEEEEEKEANSPNVFKACISLLETYFTEYNVDYELILDLKYKDKRGKEKRLGAVFRTEENIGVEVPTVKTFERSAGVSALYALKRLISAVENGVIETGIIVVPEMTSGEKYRSLLAKYGCIKEIKIAPADAKPFVNNDPATFKKIYLKFAEIF